MADRTGIEWTQATWNPITGCTRVSPGCDHCYAIRESNRHRLLPKYAGLVQDGDWTGEVRCHSDLLEQPFDWKKPRRIFVCSMSDLFHSKVPWHFICEVFDVMSACPWHSFQVLTKRPGRMAYFANVVWPQFGAGMRYRYMGAWPPNVWAGTSVETQKYMSRVKLLAQVPAKVRFVSAEPLLGRLDLSQWLMPPALHWVIVGGESGPQARTMDMEWVQDLRDQCLAAQVPFFFKQAIISGKRVALPYLDGRQWHDTPG